ncbi:MAG: DNA translocase FtsK 4TM domain-containing protein [Magnetococcales bacterium]|nr:DNA translocase FtsK 4TM domain-containing protein [Magnetococcales bacterium]
MSDQKKRQEPLQYHALLTEIGGMFIWVVTTFVFVSLVSYDQDDPSFNSSGSGVIHNLAGTAGAHTADILLQLFGYASFLIPIFAGIVGTQLLRDAKNQLPTIEQVLSFLLLMATLCILFVLLVPADWLPLSLSAGPGGLTGFLGAVSLKRYLGVLGSLALLLPLLGLSLVGMFRFSLMALFSGTRGWTRPNQLPPHLEEHEAEPSFNLAPTLEEQQSEADLKEPPRQETASVPERVIKFFSPDPAIESAPVEPVAVTEPPVAAVPAPLPSPTFLPPLVAIKPEAEPHMEETAPPSDPSFDFEDEFNALDRQMSGGGHRPKITNLTVAGWQGKETEPDATDPPFEESTSTDDACDFLIEPQIGPQRSDHSPKAAAADPRWETERFAFEEIEEPVAPAAAPIASARNPKERFVFEAEELVPAWSDSEEPTLVLPPMPTPTTPTPTTPMPMPKPRPMAAVAATTDLLPSLEILRRPDVVPDAYVDRDEQYVKARMLEQKLEDFKIKGQIVDIRPGPVVTTFELDPAPGLKSARVISIADDLARSISAMSVRVVGNIPGKSVIGIEVPNEQREVVYLREILDSDAFRAVHSPLAVALGVDITGQPVVADLAKMPHLLVAGTTGSGKSVAINAMVCSILFSARPDQVRMLMVDPKMVELSVYAGIPHLLAPVITDVKKAAMLLKWAVVEMEERTRLMSELSVRNIDGYNQRILEYQQRGEQPRRRVRVGIDPETDLPIEQEETITLETKPLILIIIDELADLMIQVGKEVEPAIARLAQMARAAGIHLIIATQRPSVDVITGLIKANFPTRLAFQVASRIDSRTILDSIGAERLLGKGDGLYMPPGSSQLRRIHAPFVSDEEVFQLVQTLRASGGTHYDPQLLAIVDDGSLGSSATMGHPASGAFGGGGNTALSGNGMDEGMDDDPLYDQAVALVVRVRRISTSMVQRHFKIGYNRAARIVERMEKEGLISEANHTGKREVMIPGRERSAADP